MSSGRCPARWPRKNIAVRTLVPGYPAVMERDRTARGAHRKRIVRRDGAGVGGHVGGLDLLVLDAPHLYARPGGPYLGPDGHDWPDNAMRFAALARVAADIGRGALRGYRPAILHAHDWQAGLAPAYLHYQGGARPGTVMTAHNLAFPGKAPREMLAGSACRPVIRGRWRGVPRHHQHAQGGPALRRSDHHGLADLCGGNSDRRGTAWASMVCCARRSDVLSGILNGIDTAIWDPAADNLLAQTFERDTLAKRVANKAALQDRLGLARDADGAVVRHREPADVAERDGPVAGLFAGVAALGAQLALIGSGEPEIEAAFRAAADDAPHRIGCVIGYDEALAHQLQAGADALLVPSRFEPCGLTQLCALRYGAVPVVARVGGLADTVIDANAAALAAGVATGVQFTPIDAAGLELALRRAAALFREPDLAGMQDNGMAADVSWSGPARQYAALFRGLVEARA